MKPGVPVDPVALGQLTIESFTQDHLPFEEHADRVPACRAG